MNPTRTDVEQMVSALMTVVNGIERAKRDGRAATLTLLYAVAARQPVRPSELSGELGVHASSVTRQVQALTLEGLVTATADPADGRSCFVSLTDAGQEEIQRLTEIGLSRFSAFVADWDAEEVQTLARLLAKFSASAAEVHKREAPPERSHWRQKKQK